MSDELKVGDRVRYVGPIAAFQGREGVIARIGDSGMSSTVFSLGADGRNHPWGTSTGNLEKVDDPTLDRQNS